VAAALHAGAARRTINPRLGTMKIGGRLFGEPIQAIQSDLTATALVLAYHPRPHRRPDLMEAWRSAESCSSKE